MKWIYGKQDWKTLERGQENCFLMTNGLGGFSSLTMLGSVTRRDHALLTACLRAPDRRVNLLHRMEETVEIGGRTYCISTQEFWDGSREEGYRYLSSFAYEDTPVWLFQTEGVEIRKEMGLKQGANTLGIRYRIRNRGGEACRLILTPFFAFAPRGEEQKEGQRLTRRGNCLSSGGYSLFFRTNGAVEDIAERAEIYYYSYDECDGRRAQGRALGNHRILCRAESQAEAVLELVYEAEPSQDKVEEVLDSVKAYRAQLEERAGFTSPAARALARSAGQFLARRESTGGETILAGFPFFGDWGRDTMIALPGLCLSTGQYESARSILRTFAAYEKGGLLPNLFPDGETEPRYNTADAALLFINCVYLYHGRTGDGDFVREIYPVMERIVDGYRRGTDHGIHMDGDGLILAGEGLDQVTWMDVRAGDVLPTPRHGKPVEINAYWYNALRVMERLGPLAGRAGTEYEALAERVRSAFDRAFWMEDRGYLKDVVSGTAADEQLRCNQIWAVSLPFTMLEEEKERRVVDAVYARLYTPCGLRTLEKADPEFHPFYGGSMWERDMAYHQGTVWTFLLGGYYLAYLKVNGCSARARETVKEQLEAVESALREGCIGQLPEIYDGDTPASSKGCFAQAWSVGELLRVYEVLEKRRDGRGRPEGGRQL